VGGGGGWGGGGGRGGGVGWVWFLGGGFCLGVGVGGGGKHIYFVAGDVGDEGLRAHKKFHEVIYTRQALTIPELVDRDHQAEG